LNVLVIHICYICNSLSPTVRKLFYVIITAVYPAVYPNAASTSFLVYIMTENTSLQIQNLSSTESRALELLGAGVGPEQTASALGLSVSRISQLLSDENFSTLVAEKRFNNLLSHNKRDNKADQLEDVLLDKLENIIPHLYKPFELIRAYQTINSAKRRGQSAPESLAQQHTIIQLTIPVQIVQHFQTNAKNQVIKAGQQDLLTIQSGKMKDLVVDITAVVVPNNSQSG